MDDDDDRDVRFPTAIAQSAKVCAIEGQRSLLLLFGTNAPDGGISMLDELGRSICLFCYRAICHWRPVKWTWHRVALPHQTG
jgi:hypothetical protein